MSDTDAAIEAARPVLEGRTLQEVTITVATIACAMEFMHKCSVEQFLARVSCIAEVMRSEIDNGLSIH